jgi:hypothetical protein
MGRAETFNDNARPAARAGRALRPYLCSGFVTRRQKSSRLRPIGLPGMSDLGNIWGNGAPSADET